jgi:hypothetical protein
MKRARFGIKMFFLLDATHKYVLRILLYQGKPKNIANRNWIGVYEFGVAAVMTLLNTLLLNAFRWADRRDVVMLNSFMNREMVESVSTNPNNTREKPSTVLTYNQTMGALDNVDNTRPISTET